MQRASNIEVKKINRNRVFRFVNGRERCSNADVAEHLGLSMPTVLNIRKELLEAGLIHEVGEYESTGGRKATAIAAVHNRYYALGVDITANHISCVLTNLSGEVLKHNRVRQAFQDAPSYYRSIETMVNKQLQDEEIEDEQFIGLGISLPGIVDRDQRTITYSHALGIRDRALSAVTEHISYSCTFINDANAAALADAYHTRSRGPAVYLSLSNTVGGAIINAQSPATFSSIDRIVQPGGNNRAGEFGHMTLFPDGKRCYCGKQGCVDVYCSAKVLSGTTGGDLKAFFDRVQGNEPPYVQTWERYLQHLALAVNNLRMAFDCPVIIGGYVGAFVEPHIDRLRALASGLNTFEPDGMYIEPCRYKIEASALGAALTLIDLRISLI